MQKIIDALRDIAENLRRIAFEIEALRKETDNKMREDSNNETVQ
jgi:hypothetical protein